MRPLEFNGNGFEYFKIWIVNILLTVITVGVYYPWAKVRNKRYFYGNTTLDNNNFEYHATGKQIFLSYLVASVILLIFIVLNNLHPVMAVVSTIAFVIAVPWIIWRSLKFNYRMSSYRNVRFGFEGGLKGAYYAVLGAPIGLLLFFAAIVAILIALAQLPDMKIIAFSLLGLVGLLFYPIYFAMISKVSNQYLMNGARFGQGEFSGDFIFKSFFNIALKSMGLWFLVSIGATMVIGVLLGLTVGLEQLTAVQEQRESIGGGGEPSLVFMAILGTIYLVLLLMGVYVAGYFKAKTQAYVFGEILFDGSMKFESTLRTNGLFGINITNILLLIFTFGLAYPWVAVRKHRYLVEHMEVQTSTGLDGYISQQGGKTNAFGEELGDAFDIDLGAVGF